MGVAGVWLAVPIAELLTMVVALIFLYYNKGRYHYASLQDLEEGGFHYWRGNKHKEAGGFFAQF